MRSSLKCSKFRVLRAGYTLIEILVVVAIIVLLFSMLLPSLSAAKEKARQIVCAAQLGQLCKAEAAYQTMNREWIPGSPLTTGHYFVANVTLNWGTAPATDATDPAPRYNRFATQMDDYATPLRAIMYGSSSIQAPNESTGDAQAVRAKLIREAMEGIFQCPSNQQVVSLSLPNPTFNDTDIWRAIRGPSYLSMQSIMRAGPNVYREIADGKAYPGVGAPNWIAQRPSNPPPAAPTGWEITAPDDYMPRHSKLGRESLKVFLADGFRFFDQTTGELTYLPDYRSSKCTWTASPPSTAEYASYATAGREYNYGKDLSYRHGNKDQINAGFFDGHVEALSVSNHQVPATKQDLLRRHFRGPAVHPKYYFPTGSRVDIPKGPDQLHAIIPRGTILP